MNSAADPWTLERAKHPAGARLVRHIDLERDEQRWIEMRVLPHGLDLELDGTTLIYPARVGGRRPEEIAHLVALYDALYLATAAR